jgi:hypothetical protein
MVIQDLRWTIPVLAPALFPGVPVGEIPCRAAVDRAEPTAWPISALLLFTINVVGLIGGPWLVRSLTTSGARDGGLSLAITVGLASFVSAACFDLWSLSRKHAMMS